MLAIQHQRKAQLFKLPLNLIRRMVHLSSQSLIRLNLQQERHLVEIMQTRIQPLAGLNLGAQRRQALHGRLGMAAVSIKIWGHALFFKRPYFAFFPSQVKVAPVFHGRAAATIQCGSSSHSSSDTPLVSINDTPHTDITKVEGWPS